MLEYIQLVRVETDELGPEGINRGDYLLLHGDATVGVVPRSWPKKESVEIMIELE